LKRGRKVNKTCKLATLVVPILVLTTIPVQALAQKAVVDTKSDAAPVCKISFVDPHTNCKESECVIETLRTIFEAYGKHDMKTVAQYIAEDCTGFGENHKLIIGKEAVLEHITHNIEERAEIKDSPLLSYTIERPYAQVTGDTAIVTFIAYKQYGGKHPRKLCSHSTDIFVKRDGKWLKSHYRNNWREVSLASSNLSDSDPKLKQDPYKSQFPQAQ